MAYVVAMTEGAEVDVADLPPRFRDRCRTVTTPAPGAEPTAMATDGGIFYERVGEFEKKLLSAEYRKTKKKREPDGAPARHGPLASLYKA